MKLSQYEQESALWKKIEATLVERLTVFREKNDGSLDPLETAKLRGSIGMIKEILSWPETPTDNFTRDL
jgi:hypothetical protein